MSFLIAKGSAVLSNVKVVSISFPEMRNETVSFLNKLLAIMTENKNEYANFKVSFNQSCIHTYIHTGIHIYLYTYTLSSSELIWDFRVIECGGSAYLAGGWSAYEWGHRSGYCTCGNRFRRVAFIGQ